MTTGSRRMLLLGATSWAGAAAGSLPPFVPAGPLALAAALTLWLAVRWRAPNRSLGPASVALLYAATFLVFAGLAALSAPAGERAPREGRLRGRVTSVRPLRRSTELRVVLDGERGPAWRVLVPRTGRSALDRLPPRVVPGARIEALVRPSSVSGEHLLAACAAAVIPLETSRGPSWLAALPGRMRTRFRTRVRQRLEPTLPSDAAGPLVALLAGDRSLLSAATTSALRRSGLAHLFVVSGLHVGWIVAGMTILLTRLGGREHRLRAVVVFAVALVALALLPSSAPVRRAGGALLLAQLGALSGRRTPPGAALGGIGCVLLAVDPRLAVGWSFALTMAATAAIVLALEREKKGPRVTAFLAPAAATWPLVVLMTGRLAPWGAAATAVALPLTLATLAAGWCAVLLPDGSTALVGTATRLAGALASATCGVVRFAGELPWSGRIAAPVGWAWCAAAEIVLLASLVSRRRAVAGVLALAFVALGAWPMRPMPGRTSPHASLEVFDVGQGQSVLLHQGPHAVLVDAADDRGRDGVRSLIAQLGRHGVRSLDALVLSHADRDHAGGAEEMLSAAPPRIVAMPEGLMDRPELRGVIRAASRRGIPIRPLRAGDRLRFGSIELVAWHPVAGDRRRSNQASLALHVRIAGFTAWLPGDAGREAEDAWLRARPPPAVDLLVAGHHGSRDATGEALLARLLPREVIVSCGAGNRFGHPHRETLERARGAGARVWLTAGRGGVSARFDGQRLLVARRSRDP